MQVCIHIVNYLNVTWWGNEQLGKPQLSFLQSDRTSLWSDRTPWPGLLQWRPGKTQGVMITEHLQPNSHSYALLQICPLNLPAKTVNVSQLLCAPNPIICRIFGTLQSFSSSVKMLFWYSLMFNLTYILITKVGVYICIKYIQINITWQIKKHACIYQFCFPLIG